MFRVLQRTITFYVIKCSMAVFCGIHFWGPTSAYIALLSFLYESTLVVMMWLFVSCHEYFILDSPVSVLLFSDGLYNLCTQSQKYWVLIVFTVVYTHMFDITYQILYFTSQGIKLEGSRIRQVFFVSGRNPHGEE